MRSPGKTNWLVPSATANLPMKCTGERRLLLTWSGPKGAGGCRVYAFYQDRLAREGSLDYGDLIARTVRLLQENPDVRDAIQKQYRHILVDEYQDVNRSQPDHVFGKWRRAVKASWVVGDLRQAVYRFRGAAPTEDGAVQLVTTPRRERLVSRLITAPDR